MDDVRRINGISTDPFSMRTTTASEDFRENILGKKRYVDKTHILIPLLRRDHEVTFFLRPRRFGKTLALSMIRYFVEDTGDPVRNMENRMLFEGMKIMQAGDFYTEQMTSYPVINLTFQSARDEEGFGGAYDQLVASIQDEYERHAGILESAQLTQRNKDYFTRVMLGRDPLTGKTTSMSDYRLSLKRLTEFLRKAYGKKAIILIDEYDVPLEKAYQNGYYKKMINVISPLLQNVLKTNSENLQFAVVTGCLRVAKESIYTGLNNPRVNTVLSNTLSDGFGFTQEEVQALLAQSGLENRFSAVKDWYDGYTFGKTTIYNPWSVINYIEDLEEMPEAAPEAHWAGTSENAIIRELAEKGSAAVREKAELAIEGETVLFSQRDNIVYAELDYHDDNVFNVMLHTGYLTVVSRDARTICARIPNREVQTIFREQIRQWFEKSLRKFDTGKLYRSLLSGTPDGAEQVREILTAKFLSSMSYYDTQEAYYHGVLHAILQLNEDYIVDSNRESGKGRFDIQCRERVRRSHAIVLEIKVSRSFRSLERDARRGAEQARTKRYAFQALREGYKEVYSYGVSFFKKDCAVCFGGKYTQGDLPVR